MVLKKLCFSALSVRALLLMGATVFVAGTCFKIWSPYHLEQRVVAQIEVLGGTVETILVRPAWIPDACHDDYLKFFQRVVRVELDGTRVRDEHLQQLHPLKHLQSLSLMGTRISDAGLVHLNGLRSLKGLNLRLTQVTDVGLRHLRGLTNLQFLALDHTRITDVGLGYLQKLTQLRAVSLRTTQISPAGLAHYRQTANLWEAPVHSPSVATPSVAPQSVAPPSVAPQSAGRQSAAFPLGIHMMWMPSASSPVSPPSP